MSKEIIQQLFRNLEASIHERLRVIEDLMLTSLVPAPVPVSSKPSELVEVTPEKDERLVTIVNETDERLTTLAEQIGELSKRLDSITGKDRAPNTILLSSTLVPEEPEAEAEVNPEVEAAEAEEEEEAEAQPEEEAEQSLDLVEFVYKGTTYYRDTETNKIYLPDDDGAVDPDTPLGLWNPETKKIQRLS